MKTLFQLWRVQTRPGPRLTQVFLEEELYGLKLAALSRTLVIGSLCVFFIIVNNPVSKWHWAIASSILIVIMWIHYVWRLKRPREVWISYILVLADFITAALFALRPQFLVFSELPAQATDKLSAQSVIVVLIAMYGLTGRANLVIWAGVSAALCWGAAIGYLLTLPDTFNITDREWAGIGIILDPYYIGIGRALSEMTLFVLAAFAVAVIVVRLRGLIATSTLVERERSNLSRYLPRDLADTLAGRDSPLDAPKVRHVVVIFVDMVGFTGRAEALGPEDTITLLRDFHEVLGDCTFEYGGSLEKFLGDGIMVTFGRTESDPEDAAKALRCACTMVERITHWTEERGDRPPIEIGIGLHMGEVVTGNIGTTSRLEPAILGDVVNTASRIQSLTRNTRYPILLSEELRGAAATTAEGAALVAGAEPLGPQPIKGRGAALDLYGLSPPPP